MTPRERTLADVLTFATLAGLPPAVWYGVIWPLGLVIAIEIVVLVWFGVAAVWNWWRAPRCFGEGWRSPKKIPTPPEAPGR